MEGQKNILGLYICGIRISEEVLAECFALPEEIAVSRNKRELAVSKKIRNGIAHATTG
jgi:hypothetical protein